MPERPYTGRPVTHVDRPSPARRAGLRAGDILLRLNGEPVYDLVDYEALSTEETVRVTFLREGTEQERVIRKDEYEPLGLGFETTLMDRMQTCRNRCLFCFIDQMPGGIRSSLNVKDDDWRMSFIMGNYVSLTNVSEEEFRRILKRRVSPLYISVHATDPALRVRLMSNPTAGRILERLQALKDAGLTFHCQAVLCPGLNDGAAFDRTVRELSALRPACLSLAAVPVGLTRFRDGLFPLRSFTGAEAEAVLAQADRLTEELGKEFLFLSDEWYLMAGRALPPVESYGEFGQIENGVGLLRLFEQEMKDALSDCEPLPCPKHVTVAGGTAANAFFKDLYQCLLPYGITVQTVPVRNLFFGGNVHVAGLVTGSDLIAAFPDGAPETLYIPGNMLRECEDVFLDGMTKAEVEERMHTRLVPFRTGYDLIEAVFAK